MLHLICSHFPTQTQLFPEFDRRALFNGLAGFHGANFLPGFSKTLPFSQRRSSNSPFPRSPWFKFLLPNRPPLSGPSPAVYRPNANEASPLLDRLANTEMIVEVEQSQNRLFSTFNAELLPAICGITESRPFAERFSEFPSRSPPPCQLEFLAKLWNCAGDRF